jgi:hypothetical protein
LMFAVGRENINQTIRGQCRSPLPFPSPISIPPALPLLHKQSRVQQTAFKPLDSPPCHCTASESAREAERGRGGAHASSTSRVVRCGVVWCGVVWCGVVWCGVVWWGRGGAHASFTRRLISFWSPRFTAPHSSLFSARSLPVYLVPSANTFPPAYRGFRV